VILDALPAEEREAEAELERTRRALFLRHWMLVFGGCLVVASLASIAYYVNAMGEKTIHWTEAFLIQAVHWMLWASFYPIFFLLMRRFHSLAVYVAATPFIIAFHAFVYLSLMYRLMLPGFRQMHWGHLEPFASWSSFFYAIFSLDFAYRVMGFSFLMAFSYALDYHQRYHDKAVMSSRLEAQLAQARLDALKMQLQPHFLFNTLNAVSALLHKDPDAADRMIARLGDFLRMTLENDGGHEVSLAEEMTFLNCYLGIEKVRFEDRLTTRVDAGPDVLPALVPNLILQPIVENAIRHGVGRTMGPGRIEIAAVRQNGRLRLQVKDNGAGWTPPVHGGDTSGVGIANTRRRLTQLYGRDHRLEFAGAAGEGCTVTLELPFRTRPEGAS
jgi:two-component system, LytTR family, sensor kinase